MNRLELGEELNRLRKAKGLTLKGMAKLVDCSFPYLSDIEKGGLKRPSYDKLIGVAREYGIELDVILDTYYKGESEDPGVEAKLKLIYEDTSLKTRKMAALEHPGPYTKALLIELHEKLKKLK